MNTFLYLVAGVLLMVLFMNVAAWALVLVIPALIVLAPWIYKGLSES